jgi:uncharacterized protein
MDTREILRTTQHLQYPRPVGPWIMMQIWHDLLFAHWPVRLSDLRPLVPHLLDLDTYEGGAWVGIVPFRMSNVHPRGFPAIKGLSAFPEMNVRTYVTSRGIPGVYFFSLDAANPLAVALARSLFHLPYFNAIMNCERIDDTIHYRSHRTHRGASEADFTAHYRPTGPVFAAQPDSIAHWLTERYNLYTVYRGRVYRAGIHHRQWPLQPAELEISCNTMPRAHNIRLLDTQPLLHYADRQEVLVWPLRCVL